MSDDSEQITALIKELQILNLAESTLTIASPTEKDMESRKGKRGRIRQELVRVLHLRDRKTS